MLLPGRYKGTRKRKQSPVIVKIECPGCGWHSRQSVFEKAEAEYAQHLLDSHYGILHCAFCPAMLPDFATLAAHVKEAQHTLKKKCLNGSRMHTEI